jgi:IPT/TIG domain
LLEWVDRFSSEEGPHLLQDAGKDGVLAFRATIAELEELVEAASDVAQQDSTNLTPGFHTPRVRRAFIELTQEIQNAVQLAGQVNRFPSPLITVVTPNSATQGNSQVVVSVLGNNFQEGARVRLTRGSGSTLEEINAQPTFFIAETQLHALFDLATAPIGTWTVAVRNPDGQEFQLLDRFFIRTADSDTLTVQNLEPPRSPARGDVEVTFTGNGLRAETSVNFGKDIEVKNTRLTLEGRLVATISISPKAAAGKRNVILTNPSSGQQFMLKDGFEVTKPATPKQA